MSLSHLSACSLKAVPVNSFRLPKNFLGVCSELGNDFFEPSLLFGFVKCSRPGHRTDSHALVDARFLPRNVQPKPGIEFSLSFDTTILTRPSSHAFPPNALVWLRSRNDTMILVEDGIFVRNGAHGELLPQSWLFAMRPWLGPHSPAGAVYVHPAGAGPCPTVAGSLT